LKYTNLYGLLRYPAVPKKTVFILRIREAAIETGDMNFVFGSGSSVRMCCFYPYWRVFMTVLQRELKKHHPAMQAESGAVAPAKSVTDPHIVASAREYATEV
jgi:hypothetical protein